MPKLFSVVLRFHFIFYAFPLLVFAQPQFLIPIACTLDENCWVVNYVDVDSIVGKTADFQCGPRSYDNHKGTDIAIRDWQEMQKGVDVLAAAEGKVIRLRDGVEDKVLTRVQLNKLKKENKSCGNGVFIEHSEGWSTIYCHLKKNSIVVIQGQTVKAGQKIAQVGHSGFVEFPHLHFGVKLNDTVIDPYTGLSSQEECEKENQKQSKSLWDEKNSLNYNPISIYATGFNGAVPKFEEIKQDASSLETLALNASVLTFWVSLYGVVKDDVIDIEIRDPNGNFFSKKEMRQEKDRARQFYFVGKRTRTTQLIQGKYRGTIKLTRILTNGDLLTREVTRTLLIE